VDSLRQKAEAVSKMPQCVLGYPVHPQEEIERQCGRIKGGQDGQSYQFIGQGKIGILIPESSCPLSRGKDLEGFEIMDKEIRESNGKITIEQTDPPSMQWIPSYLAVRGVRGRDWEYLPVWAIAHLYDKELLN
jgi:hypothetical protein